jgi:SAM-dependent methyltransferase
MQEGYHFPWRSRIAPCNGEDAYLDLVRAHLARDTDVLDVGCGQGEVALEIAGLCRSVVAYDRVVAYIELAGDAARRRGVGNVTFVCADSSSEPNGGRPRVPAEPGSFDLLISRRGPLHWIEDARRVARAGAVLIQLNPMEMPVPVWADDLPPVLRALKAYEEYAAGSIRGSVERRLALGGLSLHSCWTFDVPEVFDDPAQFYTALVWGHSPEEVPPFDAVRAEIERLFTRHAGHEGVTTRHRRFLWRAMVE